MEIKEKTSIEGLPLISPKVTMCSEMPPNHHSGRRDPHLGYMANCDSVYDNFAHHYSRQSSNHNGVIPKSIRGRLNSVGGLFPPQNLSNSLASRPSTTDGNYKPKASHVFWEDLGSPADHLQSPRSLDAPQQSPKTLVNTPRKERGKRNTTPYRDQSEASLKTEEQIFGEQQFESHKPTIPPQPLVRFNSSGDFKAVVNDLYGKKEHKPVHSSSKWMNVRRLASTKPKIVLGNGRITAVLTLKQREEKALKLKEAASRGWAIIRRYINRQQFIKSTSGAFLNWALLKQHLSSMSDSENTRKDLYERYGVIPTIQSDGTFRSVNVMRPRKALLHIVAFKTVKPRNPRTLSGVPAFRQTVLR